jgi:ABC-type arginine/histidine transport system permease subunit
MAATTTAFEAEILAGAFNLTDRGLMAGAAYKLRRAYLDGNADPVAHNIALANDVEKDALVRCAELVSFNAIAAP